MLQRTADPLRLSIREKQAQRYLPPDSARHLQLVPRPGLADVNQDLLDRMAQRFREEHGTIFQHSLSEPGIADLFNQAATDVAIRWTDPPLAPGQRDEAIRLLVSRYLGYRCLDPLLADLSNTEIMVNRYNDVWVERRGVKTRTDVCFPSDEEVFRVAQRMARRYGRDFNRDHPSVNARLPDGSRIFAITAPKSIYGTILNVRRHPPAPYSGKDLVQFGMLTEEMLDFFRVLVRGRATVLVTGAMGTGKTTVIDAAFAESGIQEHIITIEDTDELRLYRCLPNVAPLQAQCSDDENDDGATMYDLTLNALRMNGDRILIGEVRAKAILAWRLAIESGHNGIWTSLHTRPEPERAVQRAANLLAETAGMSHELALHQVRDLVDLVIHVKRRPDGRRVIGATSEVLPDGSYNHIYQYIGGRFERTGHLSPRLIAHIEDNDVEVLPAWRPS